MDILKLTITRSPNPEPVRTIAILADYSLPETREALSHAITHEQAVTPLNPCQQQLRNELIEYIRTKNPNILAVSKTPGTLIYYFSTQDLR